MGRRGSSLHSFKSNRTQRTRPALIALWCAKVQPSVAAPPLAMCWRNASKKRKRCGPRPIRIGPRDAFARWVGSGIGSDTGPGWNGGTGEPHDPAVPGWVPGRFPVKIADGGCCSQCSFCQCQPIYEFITAEQILRSTGNGGTVGTRPLISELAMEHSGNRHGTIESNRITAPRLHPCAIRRA